jgi:hypothetical protein
MNLRREWRLQMAGSMSIIIIAKLKTSFRPIPQVGKKGDPIAHIEISPLPPINILQNPLGVMGMAKYYDINPLSEFIHGEGLEYGDMARCPVVALSPASGA